MSRQHRGTSAVAVPEVRAHLLIWPAVASSPHSHTQLGYPTRDTELAPGFEVGFVTDHVFEAFEQATGADARPLPCTSRRECRGARPSAICVTSTAS